MNPKTLKKMQALVECKPNGTTPLTLTGSALFSGLEGAFYSTDNSGLKSAGPYGGRSGVNVAPLMMVAALEKLDYDKADLGILRTYFAKIEELAQMQRKASRALNSLRDEHQRACDDENGNIAL